MDTTRWTPVALKARLRADVALGAVPRPMTAEGAVRRLEFHRIVADVEAGRLAPEAGAELLDRIVAVASGVAEAA
jgi:hypothetical protein